MLNSLKSYLEGFPYNKNQTVLMEFLHFSLKKSAPFYLSLSPYVCSSLGMFVYIVYSYHLYLRGYQSQTKPNGGLKQWGCALVVSYPPVKHLVTFQFCFLWLQEYVYEIFKILSCIEAVLV